MESRTLAKIGVIGVIGAAMCLSCFAPVIALLLGAAGLSAYAGNFNHVAISLMLIFAAIMMFGTYRRSKGKAGQCCPPEQDRSDNSLGKEKCHDNRT